MRLFFALWPDAVARHGLAAIGRACIDRCRGRLVPARNLHVTLVFLGEVDPARLGALYEIGTALQVPAFPILFDRVGFLDRSGIVYAGVTRVPAPLADLQARARGALTAQGFRTEARRFLPHVTLVRDACEAPQAAPMRAPVMWHVRHIVLVESARGTGGQVYRPVRRFMLAP